MNSKSLVSPRVFAFKKDGKTAFQGVSSWHSRQIDPIILGQEVLGDTCIFASVTC